MNNDTDDHKLCECCEEQRAVILGRCRECYGAGLEDYRDGCRGDEDEDDRPERTQYP